MSKEYARDILRRNVAQICQTIGWTSINSTPLDILVHVLEKHILTLGTQAGRYAEQFNRTKPNLHDLGLVFRDMNIQLPELAEYTRSVPPIPQPLCAPIFPNPKDFNLNFLKPDSHEAVTRPMHVHEHLPPMYPEKEQDTPLMAGTNEICQTSTDHMDNSTSTCTSPEISGTDGTDKPKDPFKRPYDFTTNLQDAKRPRLMLDDEERTRKISSVMMTMSGILLPAREGKLPEAWPPMFMSEKHEKYICHSHHSSASKVPTLDESSDKKSKENKTLDGKVMKRKYKDKSQKNDGSKHKEAVANTPEQLSKSKEGHNPYNQSKLPLPKASTAQKTSMPPPPAPLDIVRPAVKQELLDIQQPHTSATTSKNKIPPESEIPVLRKIPVSKSPLLPNPVPRNKHQPATVTHMSEIKIKKEVIDEEDKLDSQPDRSKLSIFKKISNKSTDDQSSTDTLFDKPQSTVGLNNVQDHTIDNIPVPTNDNVRIKSKETHANNNNCKVLDMSKEIDLRGHEVINIDYDSIETFKKKTNLSPDVSVNKPLQLPYPKDVAGIIPKTKKEKRHKVKKEKASKLEGMTKKKKPDLFEIRQMPIPKMSSKSSKSNKPKNESKMLQMPPGFPFFPAMPTSNRNMMPDSGLIPNPGLMMPGSDILAGLTNNPALRRANLLPSPFALSASGPGLITVQNILSSMKMPPLLRLPSLEVIPVENDLEATHKTINREKDNSYKGKWPTNPKIPPLLRRPCLEVVPEPAPQSKPVAPPLPTKPPADIPKETEVNVKKKNKSHKKDKKDNDGIKIKKNKNKKDMNNDKSEKKQIKEEGQELKKNINKKRNEKKKQKLAEGLVPKLILKLGSSNSNSQVLPSSPDVFKLNIKPVVKKTEDESPSMKVDTVSHERCRSPELAQISDSVTRPPKQKHSSKHTHVSKEEAQPSSLPSGSSLSKKNRPHSSQSKYKRTPLSKNDHFDEETASRSKEPTPPPPSDSVDKPLPLSYSANLLPSPFALTASGHGLTLVQNILSSMKMPPLLRLPSLEVIPVENDLEATHKTINREKDHSHKGKSPTIPKKTPLLRRPSLEVIPVENDLEATHKTINREKDHSHKGKSPTIPKKPPLLRRPSLEVIPVENYLEATHKTIDREKDHSHKGKSPTIPKKPPLLRRPSLQVVLEPTPQSKPVAHPAPTKPPAYIKNETDVNVKKKNKSHKKDKKDKDGNKIKKNKDKKDMNNDKSEKKQKKEERQELKQNINKERNEKKKQELAEGLVPKLILKLGSSNSNSQVLPSSSDVFKLNIKPVVKKTEDESPSMKVDTVSHERCHSPELAQIPDLVTIPPKQKHSSKHTHVSEQEAPTSSLPSSSSLSEKNRLPSSQLKYKMTPLSRNCHFDEETASRSKEPSPPPPSDSVDKSLAPLSTPYYVDEYGIKIWVCPACSRGENGSPMIGCDGCDSWYHWVCVGISEEPGLAEDWFCTACAKRKAMAFAGVPSGKKGVGSLK